MSFFKSYIKQHFGLFVFVFVIWFASALAGIWIAIKADSNTSKDIAGYIETVLSSKNGFTTVLKNGITTDLKYTLLLCISSSFIVFVPFCILLIGFKSFSVGFTASFIIRLFSLEGMGVTLTTVVLPLFLSLPLWFLMFMQSMDFPIQTFRLRKRISSDDRWKMHLSYLAKMLVLFMLIIPVTLLEAFLSPYMFSVLTK